MIEMTVSLSISMSMYKLEYLVQSHEVNKSQRRLTPEPSGLRNLQIERAAIRS